MAVRIVDFSAAVKQAIGVKLASNLGDAVALLRAEIQEDLGTQGPPRSRRGEKPHRDSGDLQESIEDQLDADNLVGRVGSDMKYSGILEVNMDRAYFVPALIEHSDALARVICRP